MKIVALRAYQPIKTKWPPGGHFELHEHDFWAYSAFEVIKKLYARYWNNLKKKRNFWAETSSPKSPKWPPGGHFEFDHGGFQTHSAFGIDIPICKIRGWFVEKCGRERVSTEKNKMAARRPFLFLWTWFLSLFSILGHRQPLCTILKWFEEKKILSGNVIAEVTKMPAGEATLNLIMVVVKLVQR